MLVTTPRIAAAKPQVIEGYLKALIEAITVTLAPANKENSHAARSGRKCIDNSFMNKLETSGFIQSVSKKN